MTEQAISPLRRRMMEDMTMRKFAQRTQHDYLQRVKDFASYLLADWLIFVGLQKIEWVILEVIAAERLVDRGFLRL
jgi:hypothetical protein